MKKTLKGAACGLVFSFVLFMFMSYGIAGEPDINMEIVKSRLLQENQKSPVILYLEHEDGFPVLPDELEIIRTKKIHLLIIDKTMKDYHYRNPLPMRTAGNYVFTMIPKTACAYRVWADLESVNSVRQFLFADISGTKDCRDKEIERHLNTVYEDETYDFTLAFDTGTLKAGQKSLAKLTVRDKEGHDIDILQPLMGGYAHMVGFYDDYKTIESLFPFGNEGNAFYAIGGPTIKFHIDPVRAGYLKLFTRVRIHDRIILASFGVDVKKN